MDSPDRVRVFPEREPNESAWLSFIRDKCSDLFQIALLLSADPVTAEADVAASIACVDTSHSPGDDDVNFLRGKVVAQSVQTINTSSSADTTGATSMLQSGLWPVLRLEQPLRACFVLRTLLGYTTSACAQMLGMEEVQVTELWRIAVLQLHNATNAAASCASLIGTLGSYDIAAVGRPGTVLRNPVDEAKRLQPDANSCGVFTNCK